MSRELVHTPEGVRDIYGKECIDREIIQGLVHGAIKRFGYQDINTPTFEFFDVFAEEISATNNDSAIMAFGLVMYCHR